MYQLCEKKQQSLIRPRVLQQMPSREPPMYSVIGEGWDDDSAMESHCYTYCNKDKLILVQAARALDLPPPMLGHGSNRNKGGTAKDAALWERFQNYMIWYLRNEGYEGRTLLAAAKKVLR